MLLSMSMIKDYISGFEILQSNVTSKSPRVLKHLKFYRKDQPCIQEEELYIVRPEDLPTVPPEGQRLHLAFIGYPPAVYASHPDCESLCFSSSTDPQELFEHILEIFYLFNEYDTRIKDMIIRQASYEELGSLALELFQTPVSAYGIFEKILFLAYDPARSENRDYYEIYGEEYVPEDEKSILYTDSEFQSTFQTRGAAYSSNEIYKTQIIYYNIFIDNFYSGRFMIENAYRPFRDSDYAMVEWFGEYLELIQRRHREFHYQVPREFEQMIQNLSIPGAVFAASYPYALRTNGWDMTDTYVCTAISVSNPGNQSGNLDRLLNDGAFYLRELFDNQYIYINNGKLMQIINLSKSSHSYPETIRRLGIYLQNQAMLAGVSSIFSDFEDVSFHLHQAGVLAAYALIDKQKKLYEYDEHAQDLFLHQIRKLADPSVLMTAKVRKLVRYDRENSSDFVKTLRCYLDNNLNVSNTYQELYIARTTCLYRIGRIREISGIDFTNPSENLYLRIMLHLLENEPQSQSEQA